MTSENRPQAYIGKEHTYNLDHHLEIANAISHLEDLCPLVLNVDLFFALTNTISTIRANLQALVLHHRIERDRLSLELAFHQGQPDPLQDLKEREIQGMIDYERSLPLRKPLGERYALPQTPERPP